ncbi:hypothetical protein B0T14DRAFT_391954, partial [Immersiella caudata]
LALAALSAPLAGALLVAPGSPCSTSCGNELSSSSPAEMVCREDAYKSSSAGIVFSNCVKCETSSTYATESGTQSDLQALTYNLRFNMGYCLWGDLGNQEAEDTPCTTSMACEPFYDAISFRNYSASAPGLDYCSHWAYPRVSNCQACLVRLPNGHFLSNYLTMLDAACQQQPSNGSTISIQGNPFETTPVVITTPSPTYATVPTPDYGPVSLGARVGIAFGALAFVLVIVGFCIVCNGKRRRRAFLRELEERNGGQGWPHPKARYGNNGDMLETPASQKPLTGWDESPVSANTETTAVPRYFSPYNSNYNSPVSATDKGPGASNVNWPALSPQRLNQLLQEQSPANGSPPPAFSQWPSPSQEKALLQLQHDQRQAEIAIGLALGGDEASLRSKASNQSMNNNPYTNGLYTMENKGKNRDEAYEMVESPYSGGSTHPTYKMPAEPDAPVLHHPGYGRHHSTRPGHMYAGGL